MQQSEPDTTAQHLTELFEQHLKFSESFDRELAQSNHGTPQTRTVHRASNPIKHSISQHYHHSSHIPFTSQSPSLHPLQPHCDDAIVRLLIQNEIAPSSLLSSQLILFEQSTPDERQKLIMLWRLAPPMFAHLGDQDLADHLREYQSPTLEQEVK